MLDFWLCLPQISVVPGKDGATTPSGVLVQVHYILAANNQLLLDCRTRFNFYDTQTYMFIFCFVRWVQNQKQVAESEGGWIKTGKAATNDLATGSTGEASVAEEDSSPFQPPNKLFNYPMWLLSLPWYGVFSITVPDCTKVCHLSEAGCCRLCLSWVAIWQLLTK